ncbi:OmpA/MotB family protein [Azospirillum sp. sgz301742]
MARHDPSELPDEGLLARRARMPASNADEDHEIWLLSYSDLVTLLFSVFVMLLAITSLKDQLPTTPLPPETPAVTVPATVEDEPAVPEPPPVPVRPETVDSRPRLDADQVAVEAPEPLVDRWRARLAVLGVPSGVAVSVRQNRVGIVIGDAILFAAGQVELSAPGRSLLRRLLPVLLAAPGDIVVEGHTDATPVTGGRFPSNWELSAARASSVVRTLTDLGVPARRLSAVGYADTRPVAAGHDPVSNARNRRVAISLQADE